MIDSLIKLLEKLIELLKYRQQLQEKQFANSIDLVFQELKKVHQDYLRIFTTCATALRDESDFSKVADSLLAERLEQEAVRRSISALAESLAQNKKFKAFQPFFIEVRNYFYSSSIPKDTRSTALLAEIERCVREQQRGKFVSMEFSTEEMRQFLSQLVENTLAEARQSWTKLSQLHAEALSEVLK